MEVCYISYLCSETMFNQLYKDSQAKPGIQVQKFNRLVVEGLVENHVKVTVLTSRPMSRKISKQLFFKQQLEIQDAITWVYLPIINVPILKDLVILAMAYLFVHKVGRRNRKLMLISDVLSMPNSLGALLAGKKLNLKSAGIVTDLPEDVVSTRFFLKLYNQVIRLCKCYIFFTSKMEQRLNRNKPFVIMEGLADIQMQNNTKETRNSKHKELLYSGNCNVENGIDKLVQAVIKLKRDDLILHIYGGGDYSKELIQIQQEEKSIQYHGIVDNKSVVEKQQEVDLLVNPRPTDNEFTQYSFPSKNLEYMASGTPLLTTQLAGMPKEYYPYVFIIEDESIEGFSKKIEELFNMDSSLFNQRGLEAKKFILTEKNNIIQTGKMLKMLKES